MTVHMPVDNHMLETLARCEQEFFFRFHDHLATPRADASLTLGKAVHAGLKELYNRKPLIPFAQDAAKAAWGTGVEAPLHQLICPAAQPATPGAACTCLTIFPDKPHLTLGYAHAILELYPKVWPLEQVEVVLNETFVEADDGYSGTPDRVIRWPANGRLYLHDTKTTGLYMSDAWMQQWAHKAQIAGYLDLVEPLLKEEVVGVVVDAIHLDKRGYPKPSDFRRTPPLDYSPALRTELRSIRHDRMGRATDLLAMTDAPPSKNENACFRYNKLCTFWRYCLLDPADRADAIQLDIATGRLTQHVWNPARRDG